MRVAIEGCCHGCLDQIYRSVSKKKVDLLIICGDFQSIRNSMDLQSMSVPDKYKKMGSFQDYYTGKKKAAVFTIFIGGNHEASNYLEELKYGGFVAPNIYYMGRSSVLWYKGLRIGGLSGVYWRKDFLELTPQSYRFPYDKSTIRSIYHYRKDDYFKLYLLQRSSKMVMVSHDWPEGIYNYGDVRKLLKNKPFFQEDIKNHNLGSPFNMKLLHVIQPNYWFSAHLHVRFLATINWTEDIEGDSKKRLSTSKTSEEQEKKKICIAKKDVPLTDEIQLDMELEIDQCEHIAEKNKHIPEPNDNEIALSLDPEDDMRSQQDVTVKQLNGNVKLSTKFLALDKCLPRRNYLEVLDIGLTDENHISTKEKMSPLFLDHEYISSLRVIEKHKSRLNELNYAELLNPPADLIQELKGIKDYYVKEYENLSKEKYERLFNVPLNSFARTASTNEKEFKTFENPQTKTFLKKFIK